MNKLSQSVKIREWLRRYIPAEIIATIAALTSAWVVYSHTQSFVAAAAAGWLAEGISFYSYFVITELLHNHKKYSQFGMVKRLSLAVAAAGTNLIVEFLPAELLDNFIVRPYLLYLIPQHVHPYPLGFLVGKFSADVLFYGLAILGYEARKSWLHR